MKKGFLTLFQFVFIIYPLAINAAMDNGNVNPLTIIKNSYQAKNYSEAIEYGEKFLQKKSNVDVRYYTGLAYYQTKQYKQAEITLKPILSTHPDYIDARIALIRANIAQNDISSALLLTQAGLDKHPNNVDLLFQKALIQKTKNEKEEATKTLLMLLQINPNYQPALDLKEKINEPQELPRKISGSQKHHQYRNLYKDKKYADVINKGLVYLNEHPEDADVRYYVGLSYYKTKQYDQSSKQFSFILKHHPDYLDTRIALINVLFAQQRYNEVSKVIKNGLKLEPKNSNLLMAKVKLNLLKKDKAKSKQKSKNHLSKKNQDRSLSKTSPPIFRGRYSDFSKGQTNLDDASTRPHYVFGAGTSIMDVTLPDQYWNYSTLALYRKQDNITYGAELNYANRLSQRAVQGGIVAIPELGPNTWLQLAYYYANEPAIFPDQTFYGEIYQNVFKFFTLSAGNTYRKISNTYFNTYTGSFTAYVNDFSFNFRPLFYQTKSGPNSILYRFNVRYYFDNPDQFVGLTVYSGTSPDLFNLNTVDFFRVRERIIMAESQFALTPFFLIQLGGGYQNQRFLNNRVRDLAYLNLGFKYRFGYA